MQIGGIGPVSGYTPAPFSTSSPGDRFAVAPASPIGEPMRDLARHLLTMQQHLDMLQRSSSEQNDPASRRVSRSDGLQRAGESGDRPLTIEVPGTAIRLVSSFRVDEPQQSFRDEVQDFEGTSTSELLVDGDYNGEEGARAHLSFVVREGGDVGSDPSSAGAAVSVDIFDEVGELVAEAKFEGADQRVELENGLSVRLSAGRLETGERLDLYVSTSASRDYPPQIFRATSAARAGGSDVGVTLEPGDPPTTSAPAAPSAAPAPAAESGPSPNSASKDLTSTPVGAPVGAPSAPLGTTAPTLGQFGITTGVLSIDGTSIDVSADDTFEALAERIHESDAEVRAEITPEQTFSLTSTAPEGAPFTFDSDSSGLLTALQFVSLGGDESDLPPAFVAHERPSPSHEADGRPVTPPPELEPPDPSAFASQDGSLAEIQRSLSAAFETVRANADAPDVVEVGRALRDALQAAFPSEAYWDADVEAEEWFDVEGTPFSATAALEVGERTLGALAPSTGESAPSESATSRTFDAEGASSPFGYAANAESSEPGGLIDRLQSALTHFTRNVAERLDPGTYAGLVVDVES